jgi:guanylate kinase
MTPHGISHIDPNDRKNTFIMYLDMKLGVRQRRLAQRSDADSVERRLAADDRDFADFKDFDIKITNHDF